VGKGQGLGDCCAVDEAPATAWPSSSDERRGRERMRGERAQVGEGELHGASGFYREGGERERRRGDMERRRRLHYSD
jgi:hypothetical protein